VARLGAVLFVVLGVLLMDAKSLWSGGVEWGTAVTDRADAFWMDDGAEPSGRLMPDIAIAGELLTDQLQSASWELGISDFLADLSPNTASFSFVGQVSASPGDDVVVSTGWGVAWAGRVDTKAQTRDTAGDYWTTVTATDYIGALGAARLDDYDTSYGSGDRFELNFEGVAADLGITLDVVNDTVSGFPVVISLAAPFNGSFLDLMNQHAKAANLMLAMHRDGTFHAVMREARADFNLSNGDFEVNTTGWSAYAGGSISRTTTTPLSGVAEGRVGCVATQYSGAVYPLTGTFLAGHTYRLSVNTELISGENAWYIQLFSAEQLAHDGYGPDESFTATGTPTVRTMDFTPTIDLTDVEVYIGASEAVPTVGVLAIDDVTVVEYGLQLTGINAPVSWVEDTSIDVDINRWYDTNNSEVIGTDDADIEAYGNRSYETPDEWTFSFSGSFDHSHFDDWVAYGGSQRPIASGELVVSSWSQDDLILLNPFQWVTEDGTDWQVMRIRHDVTPTEWRVSITADNLLDLL
jgi:hypothetical protein